MESGASTDAQVLAWTQRKVQQFKDHLAAVHPDDPRTRDLHAKLRVVSLLPSAESAPSNGTWKNGKFKHSTGTLFVAPRDTSGAIRSESSLHKTIVHEMAHATRYKEPGEESHSQAWKQTWLWFLEIATQELGWTVDIKCAECSLYGLCEPAQCPKCTWMQNLCRPYTGR